MINALATDRQPSVGYIQLSIHWTRVPAGGGHALYVSSLSWTYLRHFFLSLSNTVHVLFVLKCSFSIIWRFLNQSSCTRKRRSWCWRQGWLSWSLAGCPCRVRKSHLWLQCSSSDCSWRAGLTHPESLERKRKLGRQWCLYCMLKGSCTGQHLQLQI